MSNCRAIGHLILSAGDPFGAVTLGDYRAGTGKKLEGHGDRARVPKRGQTEAVGSSPTGPGDNNQHVFGVLGKGHQRLLCQRTQVTLPGCQVMRIGEGAHGFFGALEQLALQLRLTIDSQKKLREPEGRREWAGQLRRDTAFLSEPTAT